jgi:hypothetical protein
MFDAFDVFAVGGEQFSDNAICGVQIPRVRKQLKFVEDVYDAVWRLQSDDIRDIVLRQKCDEEDALVKMMTGIESGLHAEVYDFPKTDKCVIDSVDLCERVCEFIVVVTLLIGYSKTPSFSRLCVWEIVESVKKYIPRTIQVDDMSELWTTSEKRQFSLFRNKKGIGNKSLGCFVQLQNLSTCEGHPVRKYMQKTAILYIEFFHKLMNKTPKTVEV